MGALSGKVAFVTGGGRGLGRAIALELAQQGASVAISDFFVDEAGVSAARVVADEIESLGQRSFADSSDLSDFDQAQRVVQASATALGGLDILVTCAGNFSASNICDVQEGEWDSVFDIHLTGHLACLTAAAQTFIEQGRGGHIVTVSSRGALFGPQVAYAGAKAGILGLTAAAARELAPHGVNVNCLLPSAQTQLFTIPASSRRFGGMPESLNMDPSHIAPLIAFLCSQPAGETTGQFIYASGGDLCLYAEPLQLAGKTSFIRSDVPWTPDSLSEHLPSLLGGHH
jgi:NAD(P)-dependent dehydrogenase (short-subunit alcohol dehydrogenase family)